MKTKYAKLRKKLPRYDYGGNPSAGSSNEENNGGMSSGANAAITGGEALASTGGALLTNSSYKIDKSVDPYGVKKADTAAMVGGDALQYASMGAGIGSVAGPWGTLIGAGVGAIGGAIYGGIDAGNINDKAKAEEQAYQQRLRDWTNQKNTYDLQQQKIYSNNYYKNNPVTGTQGASLMAYGGKLPTYAPGGQLTPIANGVVKAEGDTHSQDTNRDGMTGIALQQNGQPYAEVEDQEVINKGKVYSDRLSPNNNKTYAEISEKLAKKKGKFEETLKDTYNIPTQNTSKRSINNIDTELEALFQHQEANKPEEGFKKAYGGMLNTPNHNPLLGRDKQVLNLPTYTDNGAFQRPMEHNILAFGGETNYGVDPTLPPPTMKKVANGDYFSGTVVPTQYTRRSTDSAINAEAYNLQQAAVPIAQANTSRVVTDGSGNRIRINADGSQQIFDSTGNKLIYSVPAKAYGGKLPAFGTGGSASTSDGGSDYSNIDWSGAVQKVVPYLDNIYNAGLIQQTPQVPQYTTKVAYNMTPANFNTDYNINPALNDAQSNYNTFTKGVTQNTASSQSANAQKMGAFADILNNKSRLYGEKINTENQLKNINSQNTQQVMNYNSQNNQNIANENLSQQDKYNWAKVDRENNILQQKSQNVANVVGDATKQIQDKNAQKLDEQRIMNDALKYPNGAGVARLVGSSTMDDMIRSNKDAKAQFRRQLEDSKQTDALRKFNERYGND